MQFNSVAKTFRWLTKEDVCWIPSDTVLAIVKPHRKFQQTVVTIQSLVKSYQKLLRSTTIGIVD